MNRRGFLRGILAAGVAPAFVGSSVLMPIRALVVSPLSGEITYSGGSLLSIDLITQEALRILHKNMRFICRENSMFTEADRLVIRIPNRCVSLDAK